MKLNDVIASFFPEIDLSIDAQETNFATVPFKITTIKKRIEDDWTDVNIVPLSQDYDVVALILPQSQWTQGEVLGLQACRPKVPVITITADENEVWRTREHKQYVTVFEEGMIHELAHYFYGLTPAPRRHARR